MSLFKYNYSIVLYMSKNNINNINNLIELKNELESNLLNIIKCNKNMLNYTNKITIDNNNFNEMKNKWLNHIYTIEEINQKINDIDKNKNLEIKKINDIINTNDDNTLNKSLDKYKKYVTEINKLNEQHKNIKKEISNICSQMNKLLNLNNKIKKEIKTNHILTETENDIIDVNDSDYETDSDTEYDSD